MDFLVVGGVSSRGVVVEVVGDVVVAAAAVVANKKDVALQEAVARSVPVPAAADL
jgi:hypothetical protein